MWDKTFNPDLQSKTKQYFQSLKSSEILNCQETHQIGNSKRPLLLQPTSFSSSEKANA